MLATKGIIIRTLKYGETSLILDLFTPDKGLISCIVGGVRKKKSGDSSMNYQLLTILDARIYYTQNDSLNRIKETKRIYNHNELLFHPLKRLLVTFVAEVLQKTLRSQEDNFELYDFLVDQMEILDGTESSVANFHIFFLLELSKILGFYPKGGMEDGYVFLIEDGTFAYGGDFKNCLSEEESRHLSAFMEKAWQEASEIKLTSSQRKKLLDGLIKFYQFHVGGFGLLKSPEVLSVVLS